MAAVWCVAHAGGWHMVRGGAPYPDGTTKIETACYRIVTDPGEPERREPECLRCKAAAADHGDGEIDF